MWIVAQAQNLVAQSMALLAVGWVAGTWIGPIVLLPFLYNCIGSFCLLSLPPLASPLLLLGYLTFHHLPCLLATSIHLPHPHHLPSPFSTSTMLPLPILPSPVLLSHGQFLGPSLVVWLGYLADEPVVEPVHDSWSLPSKGDWTTCNSVLHAVAPVGNLSCSVSLVARLQTNPQLKILWNLKWQLVLDCFGPESICFSRSIWFGLKFQFW